MLLHNKSTCSSRRAAPLPPHSHAGQIKLICESNIIVCVSFSFLLPARCTHAYYFFSLSLQYSVCVCFWLIYSLHELWVIRAGVARACVCYFTIYLHTHTRDIDERERCANKQNNYGKNKELRRSMSSSF